MDTTGSPLSNLSVRYYFMQQKKVKDPELNLNMASDCHFTDSVSEEEEEFDRMLKRIGGKANIYLVGAADGENNCNLFQEFLMDMFRAEVRIMKDTNPNLANGDIKSGAAQNASVCEVSEGKRDHNASVREKCVRHTRAISRHNSRAIHCAVIIFIFTHGFLLNKVTL